MFSSLLFSSFYWNPRLSVWFAFCNLKLLVGASMQTMHGKERDSSGVFNNPYNSVFLSEALGTSIIFVFILYF